MFDVKISEKVISYCWDQLKRYNFGMRSHSNGSKEQQLRGIVAESIVREFCGLEWIDGSEGFDDGEDLRIGNYICDVKTMKRKCPPLMGYVGNFPEVQLKYKTNVLIFTSINTTTRVLTICGWIPKDEFKEKANFFKKGTMRKRTDGTEYETQFDNCEIKYSYLRPTFNPDHLMDQIYMGWIPNEKK